MPHPHTALISPSPKTKLVDSAIIQSPQDLVYPLFAFCVVEAIHCGRDLFQKPILIRATGVGNFPQDG